MRTYLLALAAVALVGLGGCQQKGPVEEAGERVDEIIDNVDRGDPPLKEKGTLEKMGDSIDDSLNKDR